MSLTNAMKQPFCPREVKTSEAESTLIRLAERDQFSPRLRDVLQGLLALCASGLELRISETLTEFEKQLVRLADKATMHQQNLYFDSIGELKRRRADVAPRFLLSLENSLARLGEAVTASSGAGGPASATPKLALTDSMQLDESLVLSDIATKVELRVREPLYALGHRFGVLAGTLRIACEIMPLGPRSITAALRFGTSTLDLVLEHRLVLYRCFERVVMSQIGSLYVTLNNFLVERDILPCLHMLPTRRVENGASCAAAVPGPQAASEAPANHASSATGVAEDAKPLPIFQAGTGPRRVCTPIRQGARSGDFFGTLRQLLGECRRAEAYTASGDELQVALAALQVCQAAATGAEGKLSLHSAEQIKQEILAFLRERCADGRAPRLSEEDGDAIDLTAMLFEFLSRRARSDGIANWILAKLQMPVLRAALKDKSFFSDAAHGARRLLNDFVEAGRFWVDENEDERDPTLVEKLQRLTNHVACEYQGEALVFAGALQELSGPIQTLVHKVEVAERRHVEAAVGHEKLERCGLLAAAAIAERIAGNKPGEFLRTLLERGWKDVLTITLLRDGEGSAGYMRRLDVVDRLLAGARAKENGSDESLPPDLRTEVESGLTQVGLLDDDIRAITQKLFARADADQEESPISQTELAIKLKLKARLGEHQAASAAQSILVTDEPRPLDPGEQAVLDRLHTLAPGTWFEFKVNQQGDTARRKLAWYSTQTGRCLFINQRGAASEQRTLRDLACEIASEQAWIVSTQQESLVDRAWAAICGTLRNFSERKDSHLQISSLAERRLGQPPRLTAQAGQPQQKESRTLLLVDDEVNIQRALTRVLRGEGYRILGATSARDAIEILGQHEVQVIIADQRMPDVTGTEFLTIVKTTHPNTVGILLSGYSDAAAVTDAINRGAIYKFLTKPWDDDDIRLQVREAFGACELC